MKQVFRIKYKYIRTWWWKKIHYNYFHKKLFKEYYVRKRKFTEKEHRKYQLYKKLDDIITLRYIGWIRILIWKLDR